MTRQYQIYLTEQEIAIVLLALRSKDINLTLSISELNVLERIKEYLKVVKRVSDLSILEL